MSAASIGTHEIEQESSVAGRIVDAARRAAHFPHEVRLVKSMAEDAIEDGVCAARRTMKSARRHSVETLEDFKDETAHCVKRQPLKAIGVAAGAGLVVGMAIGWIVSR